MVFLFRGNWVLTVPLLTLIQTEFSLTDIQTPSVTVTQSWTHHVTLSFDAGHVTQINPRPLSSFLSIQINLLCQIMKKRSKLNHEMIII